MTTSLPTTSSDPTSTASGSAPAISADLAALFAANPSLYAGGSIAAAQNFGAMLNADNGNFAASLTPTATTPATKSCAPTRATDPRVLANLATDETDTGTTLPDRTTLEAALALVLPLVSAQTPPPAELGVAESAASVGDEVLSGTGEGGGATESALAGTRVTLTLPGQPAMQLSLETETAPAAVADTLAALAQNGTAGADEAADTSVASDGSDVAQPQTAASPSAQVPTRAAAEVVVSQKLAMPAATPSADDSQATTTKQASASPVSGEAESDFVALTASVELSDGSVVQVSSPEPSAESGAVSATSAEKNAASSDRENGAFSGQKNEDGKNFLSAMDKGLSSSEKKGGIAVAQEPSPMFLPPHDALPAVSPTVSAHVAFVAAPAAAEPAPMPELTAATLAHRAVETVTNVVEAQEASKLQPVPSVQLKFRIGSDDLAVRVELRDGVVRTEFRTNSSELRTAIDQEWKAVTAQPSTALRYLDPVFSSAGGSTSNNNAFSQGNPQQSAAQQQQQQQQQQAHQQARAAAEFFGTVGRSTPYQPREGGAAATSTVPLIAPTSHHLSAVA